MRDFFAVLVVNNFNDGINIPEADLILCEVDIHLLHDLVHHVLLHEVVLQQGIPQEVNHQNTLNNALTYAQEVILVETHAQL